MYCPLINYRLSKTGCQLRYVVLLLMVTGRIQVEGLVIHVVVQQCFNLNSWLLELESNPEGTAEGVFYKGRNFK
jgi:hypothetical protein